MTNSVILYGTTGDGSTLPVQVDATGRLIAEGLQGPPGEQGEPGIGELPPNPEEGQVLGWQDGQLVWMNGGGGGGGFFFGLDYVIIGGGGNSAVNAGSAVAGGGAGGFYSTVSGEKNPGNVSTPGPKYLPLAEDGVLLSLTVGGVGEASRLIGPDWDTTMEAGADAGTGDTGASGGGQLAPASSAGELTPIGNGIPGQGYAGGTGMMSTNNNCYSGPGLCHSTCRGTIRSGGGGGAGGPANALTAGAGITSTITGKAVVYSAGGNGGDACPDLPGGGGGNTYGCGGGRSYDAQPGAIILRYANVFEISDVTGDLEHTIGSDGVLEVATFTAGSGQVSFNFRPEVISGTVIDLLRRVGD